MKTAYVRGMRRSLLLILAMLMLASPFVHAQFIENFLQLRTPGAFSMNTTTLNIMTANTSRIYITQAGFIGMGTTNPAYRLTHVGSLNISNGNSGITPNSGADDLIIDGGSAATGLSLLSTGGNSANIYFGDDGDAGAGQITYNHGSNFLSFTTNGAGNERLRITSLGYMGIGTSSPTKALSVNGTLNAITFDPSAGVSPLINTTGSNLTISSATGSVIIRLGG